MAYSEKAKALRRCKALRKDGKPCQAWAVWGENYCVAHFGRHHRGPMPNPYERNLRYLVEGEPCPSGKGAWVNIFKKSSPRVTRNQ